MRTRFSLLFALLLAVTLVVLPIAAQEATEEPTPDATAVPDSSTSDVVFCEPDLIVQLYIAERYFGFGSVSTFDTSVIDKGDLTPLFASLTAGTRSMLSNSQIAALTAATPIVDPNSVANCNTLGQALREFYARVAQIDTLTSTDTTQDTAAGDIITFTAPFSGPAEVPGPGDADGIGTATVILDPVNSQVCYTLSVQNIDLPAAAAHIHNAPVGESGGVVVPFTNAPDASGNATGCETVDPEVIANIIADPQSFYVNVHTTTFPDGAVRAQLGF